VVVQIKNNFWDDLEDYFKQDDLIQSSNQILLKGRTREPIRYAMEVCTDVIRYTFEINEYALLLISTHPDANSDLIISRILDYLNKD